jgi:hypothetical protein
MKYKAEVSMFNETPGYGGIAPRILNFDIRRGDLLFICLTRFASEERKWNPLDIKVGLDPEPI